ncbi:MAG: RICIN domain-containing protein [Blautia sp.]|nr:RICIN domain-containing protein [Blautia sp.]
MDKDTKNVNRKNLRNETLYKKNLFKKTPCKKIAAEKTLCMKLVCMVMSMLMPVWTYVCPSAGELRDVSGGAAFAVISAVDLSSAVCPGGEDGSEAVIREYSGDDSMLFTARETGDGSWYLENPGSGLYLAVSDNSSESGAGTALRELTGDDGEKWFITGLPDGHYEIASKLGTVLDLAGADTEEGTAVLLCSKNGGLNQEWDILPEGKMPPAAQGGRGDNITGDVMSGMYRITSALDDHLALTITDPAGDGSRLELCTYGEKDPQVFQIIDKGDGTFHILSAEDEGLSLDVKDASPEPGAVLQMRSFDATAGQIWSIVPSEEFGYYEIGSSLGTMLDVSKGIKKSGASVGMFSPTGGRNQMWRLFRVG